uniref:Uncharacterized protein n=1 Tax=Rhizophora mucronata TaxID=61149 RepID=A0A2P2LG11_RHIMU
MVLRPTTAPPQPSASFMPYDSSSSPR